MGRNPIIDAAGNIVSENGKILNPQDYTVLVVPKQKKKLKERDWLMFYQAGLAQLAKDKELRGAPRSVLDMLMSMMDFENFIGIDQSFICKELNMEKASVSKAIKLLVEKKILEKGPKFGRMNSYKLNEFYAWRGTVENKRKAQVLDFTKALQKSKQK
jgi:predicted transcriptional regulator